MSATENGKLELSRTSATRTWNFINESVFENIHLDRSIPSSRHEILNQFVFNRSGSKFYTASVCKLQSFDPKTLSINSEYELKHNLVERFDLFAECSSIENIATNKFYDNILYFSFYPEIVIFDTNRNEIIETVNCGISRWNSDDDCLIEDSIHDPHIFYFTVKQGKIRSIKSYNWSTSKTNSILSFCTKSTDSIFLSNPMNENKFVVVDNLKLLFFDINRGDKANLQPSKVINTVEEGSYASGGQRIMSIKFNSNGQKLVVNMSNSLSFIIDTLFFTKEMISVQEDILNADFIGNDSNYIVASTGNEILIYSRSKTKVIRRIKQDDTVFNFAISPTDRLLAVNTLKTVGMEDYTVVKTFKA